MRKKFKILFLGSFLLVSCNGQIPPFGWNPEIWATDSRMQVIVREEGAELGIIRTSDPQFDDFICLRKDEIRKAIQAYQEVTNQCLSWKK